jgi:hypothetical protein
LVTNDFGYGDEDNLCGECTEECESFAAKFSPDEEALSERRPPTGIDDTVICTDTRDERPRKLSLEVLSDVDDLPDHHFPVWIYGSPGSGKSTAQEKMKKDGITVSDTDDLLYYMCYVVCQIDKEYASGHDTVSVKAHYDMTKWPARVVYLVSGKERLRTWLSEKGILTLRGQYKKRLGAIAELLGRDWMFGFYQDLYDEGKTLGCFQVEDFLEGVSCKTTPVIFTNLHDILNGTGHYFFGKFWRQTVDATEILMTRYLKEAVPEVPLHVLKEGKLEPWTRIPFANIVELHNLAKNIKGWAPPIIAAKKLMPHEYVTDNLFIQWRRTRCAGARPCLICRQREEMLKLAVH